MRKAYILIVLAGTACLLLLAFSTRTTPAPGIPQNVEEVLKTSCFDCHSHDAKSKKGKLALNFEKWEEYKVTKRIGKLDDICELISEGKMPPEKYLKSKPEAALSDAQKKMLCEWTKQESANLMEGD